MTADGHDEYSKALSDLEAKHDAGEMSDAEYEQWKKRITSERDSPLRAVRRHPVLAGAVAVVLFFAVVSGVKSCTTSVAAPVTATWTPIVGQPSPTSSAVSRTPSSTTPTPTPTSTPTIDPAVAEWIVKVGGGYGPEDAKWACDTLAAPDYPLPWSAVGDDRLIWAGRLLCTQYKAQVERAALGFRGGGSIGDGSSDTVRPGTYVTEPGVTDCYWERVTGGGKTIANDFVTLAPKGVTVKILKTDGGFTSDGCGPWAAA